MPAGVVRATRVRPGEEQPRKVRRDVIDRAAREVELGSAGLPIGVQVAARAWREDIVLAVMAALETAFREQPEYPPLRKFAVVRAEHGDQASRHATLHLAEQMG